MRHLEPFDLRWIEEPTSPDDVLGHAAIRRAVAPVGVATGEHAANRVIFKQLLQAEAIDYCQIDACRLGGVNEVLAVLLLAAKFDVPVCPHAGGLGLCEYVQHLCVDRLRVRERFARRSHDRVRRPSPRALRASRPSSATAATCCPTAAGYSVDLHPESYATSDGWTGGDSRRSSRRGGGRRALGLGCAPIGNLFAGVSDEDAQRDGRRRVGRRHPLLRHRAALRARRVRAPPRPRAARPAARRVRALDEGRARAATGRAGTRGDDLHRRRRSRAPLRLLATTGSCARSRRASPGSGTDRIDVVLVHDPDDHEDDALRSRVPDAPRASATKAS